LSYLELYFRISAALLRETKTKQNKLKNKLLVHLPPPTLFSFPVCNDHESSENRATSKSTSEPPPHFERNQKKTNQTTQQHKTNKLENKLLINLPPPTLFSFPVCNDREPSENRATSKSASEPPPHFERNQKKKNKTNNTKQANF
jgi:hypothetical protein